MVDKLHGIEKTVAVEDREVRKDQESRFLCLPKKVSEPTLLLMAGFAGVGKTALAKKLNESLRWKMLSKDDLKLRRLKNGEEIEQAGWNAFDELFELIEEVIIKGESVIIDTSNEHPFIFEHIMQILETMEKHRIRVHLKVLLCFADEENRTRRLHERGSMFFPHVKELPTILDDSKLLPHFNHLLFKEKKTLEYPAHHLNGAELSERFYHFLKDANLPEHCNDLLKDEKLLEHFNELLKDEEALKRVNLALHAKKVRIVNTNPPLATYCDLVLEEVQNELT